MSSTTTDLTPCHYLFNQSANEMYPKLNGEFVNQSLEKLMQIIDHLVIANPEALFIFDPTAFNNQCHLYALIVAQAVNQPKIQSVVTTLLKMPDNVKGVLKGYIECIDRRFLYLSCFLSYAFLTDPKLLEKVACKALTAMKEAAPSKEFRLFVKDPGNTRTHVSRSSLNVLFETHMKETLASGENSELAKIAHANLQLAPSSGRGTLYTFPKFAGVVYLVETIFYQNISLLFKVKVITKEGVGSFSYSSIDIQALGPMEPVVVFEMVATGDNLSYLECRDIAKQCPTHSRRNVSSKDRHDPKKSCLFCSSKQIDVGFYQKKFQPILSRPRDLFFALGADFVIQNQKPFLPFFSDPIAFPQLTHLFKTSVPNIKASSLSMTDSLSMSVSHVYTDCAAQASKSSLVIDAAYETHLQERGLI